MITRIDMHIRDERLYEWLKDKQHRRITANEMAQVHKCHKNTVLAMLKRLIQAQLIEVEGVNNDPNGNYYRIVTECNENSA